MTYLRKYSEEIIEGVKAGKSAEELGLSKRIWHNLCNYYVKNGGKRKGNKSTGKTGRHSWHSKPLGTERIRGGYIYVKIAYPRVERLKHHLEWEKYNTPIDTKKELLIFLDDNTLNCDISNLYKIERKYLGAYNKLRNQQLTPDQKKVFLKAVELYVTANSQKEKKPPHPITGARNKERVSYIATQLQLGTKLKDIAQNLSLKSATISYYKDKLNDFEYFEKTFSR